MSSEAKSTWVRIWDPFVRVAHWILAATFFVAYLTEDEFQSLHVWAGYTVGVIVLARIVWGFFGTRHARFRNFVCSPIKSVRYFINLIKGRSRRYLGHSPAGAAMVLLLILGIAVTGWSGLMVYAYEEQAGPLASYVLPSTETTSSNYDEDVEEHGEHGKQFEAKEEFWEETHEVAANLTLLLVILHVLGVIVASLVHHENLVRSMFTGKKVLRESGQ